MTENSVFSDPVLFAEKILNFHPYEYQKRVLRACIEKKRVVAIFARQSGKSTIVAIFCLFWALAIPNQSVVICSPTQKQSGWLFDKIRGHIFQSKYLQTECLENYKTKITFKNGSVIQALTVGATGKSIKGATANILVMEESALIKDGIVNEVIMPMLAATDKKGGTIIQLSTPKGKNHFWRATLPKSGYEVIHVDYKECIEAGQYSAKFIEEQKKTLSPDHFASEYLAVFTDSEGAVFPYDIIDPHVYDSLKLAGTPDRIDKTGYSDFFLGIDLGRFGSSTVFTVIGKDINRVFDVLLIMEMRKASFKLQLSYLNFIVKYVPFKRIGIDSTGMGLSLYEVIKDKYANMVPINFNTKSKQEMIHNFRTLLRDNRIRLPNHQKLISQLVDQTYKLNSQGDEIYSPSPGVHDDLLWSLMLAALMDGKAAPVFHVHVNA